MKNSIEAARQIKVVYVNGEEEVTERILNPLLIFVERGESYLIADDLLTGEQERVFRVDRLLECNETGYSFQSRPVVFEGWKFRGDVVDAELYVAPGNEWVLDRIETKDHIINDDGSMFLWVEVASRGWLGRLLLRCGGASCVVSRILCRALSLSGLKKFVRNMCDTSLWEMLCSCPAKVATWEM